MEMPQLLQQLLAQFGADPEQVEIASRIKEEIEDDVANGELIVIDGQRLNGPKLRDSYPSVALGVLAGLQICHKTIYNTMGPNRVHVIYPEAFERSGLFLPRSMNLWRYQDGWKFVDLLDSGEIYLTSLKSLEDPSEGFPTESLRQLIEIVEKPDGSSPPTQAPIPGGSMLDVYEAYYKECCVSCWHISDGESTAMWDLCDSPRSVAIRTSVGDLVDAVEHERYAGTWKVHYLDYKAEGTKQADRVLTYNPKFLATHKDTKYSYEKEFRILYANDERIASRLAYRNHRSLPEREYARINVRLPRILHEIRIHPEADASFAKEIGDLVRDRLPKVQVERSSLT